MVRPVLLVLASLVACKSPTRPIAPDHPPPPGLSSAHRPAAHDAEAPDEPPARASADDAAAADGRCNPFVAPPERREGDLLVLAPPPARERPEFLGRLRSHVEGGLSRGSARTWVGPQVPGFLPLTEGTTELHLLERSGDDFVAIYRDPYGASSCTLSGPDNCEVFAVAYDPCGEQLWARRLDDVMSRRTHLEIQDVRVADGILYFNEACQSYSKEAGRKCSSLVAYDPVADEVLWRTKPLVSNNRFVVVGDLIVAGYGFTAEPDFVFLVRRRDGKVLQRQKIPRAHDDLRLDDDGILIVHSSDGSVLRFELQGRDTASPLLVPLR